MFGYQGGESLETVTRKKAYRTAARERWNFLTSYDLTTVKNAAQLSALIQHNGRAGRRRSGCLDGWKAILTQN
jgi:hypothetical protein